LENFCIIDINLHFLQEVTLTRKLLLRLFDPGS
jgi:hypothetical protein